MFFVLEGEHSLVASLCVLICILHARVICVLKDQLAWPFYVVEVWIYQTVWDWRGREWVRREQMGYGCMVA